MSTTRKIICPDCLAEELEILRDHPEEDGGIIYGKAIIDYLCDDCGEPVPEWTMCYSVTYRDKQTTKLQLIWYLDYIIPEERTSQKVRYEPKKVAQKRPLP